MYIKNDLNCTKIPYRYNFNNLEITVMVLTQPIPNIHSSYNFTVTISTVLLGDFNIDLIQGNSEQKALHLYQCAKMCTISK